MEEGEGAAYVIDRKSKGLLQSKFLPLNGTCLPNRKYFGCNIGIQINNTPLVVEQYNCTTETVNAYILYDVDNWPEILLRNFPFKNCLVQLI